jgi:uncharacterized protein YbgA (DUF1722 family)
MAGPKGLTNKMLEGIEVMLAHPDASYMKLAEMIGVNRNTITAWKHNETFMAEYKRRLKEIWADSEAVAVRTMISLATEGDFKASKYILDSMDYAPTTKIEADVKTDINITIE